VVYAIEEVAKRIIGMDVEAMFADMGAFWEFRTCSTLRVVSITNDQSSPTPNTDG
jgi:hypothetical protein